MENAHSFSFRWIFLYGSVFLDLWYKCWSVFRYWLIVAESMDIFPCLCNQLHGLDLPFEVVKEKSWCHNLISNALDMSIWRECPPILFVCLDHISTLVIIPRCGFIWYVNYGVQASHVSNVCLHLCFAVQSTIYWYIPQGVKRQTSCFFLYQM